MKKLKIWQWYTLCCHKDLEEIKTQEDLDQVMDMLDDISIDIYDTKMEALLDILSSWVNSYSINRGFKEIDEVFSLIKKELWKIK